MASEEWHRSGDGLIELCPVLDWETGVEDPSRAGILRLWFQIENGQCNEDVQLKLTTAQVGELGTALKELETAMAQSDASAGADQMDGPSSCKEAA